MLLGGAPNYYLGFSDSFSILKFIFNRLINHVNPVLRVWSDYRENVLVIPLLSTKGSLVSKLQKNASGSCLLLSKGSDFRLMHFYSQYHENDNTAYFCRGFSNVIHYSTLIIWQALRKLDLKPLVTMKLHIKRTKEINIFAL